MKTLHNFFYIYVSEYFESFGGKSAHFWRVGFCISFNKTGSIYFLCTIFLFEFQNIQKKSIAWLGRLHVSSGTNPAYVPSLNIQMFFWISFFVFMWQIERTFFYIDKLKHENIDTRMNSRTNFFILIQEHMISSGSQK